jgi:hypothetical protein
MSDRHPNIYNEFDLQASRKAGQADELERIIKLLEDEELQNDLNNPIKDYDQLVWLGIKEQLIALIKGGQNA